jgi:hypothetical protein
MRQFEFRVTQELKGHYEGTIVIEADSKAEAKKIIKSLSQEDIDEQADWTHGDQYDGDVHTIEVDFNVINEV